MTRWLGAGISVTMRALPLLLLLLAAGCVGPPMAPVTPPPAAAPRAPVAAPPPAAIAWQDAALTPGSWSYRRDATGSVADYGTPGAGAAFTLRCDMASRHIQVTAGGSAAPLTIRTTSLSRTLSPAQGRAVLSVDDPLLDAMNFSRGRFAVEAAGGARMILPTWAEPQRVTEDCRG